MNIAIISDDLTQRGGQENVLALLSDIFPKAAIYTSIASKKWQDYFKSKNRVLYQSFLKNIPYADRLIRYLSPLLLSNVAYESFDLNSYDLVLSCTSRFAHNVITNSHTKHLCYTHSPGRMIWNPKDYFRYEPVLKNKIAKFTGESLLKYPLSIMRELDYISAQRVDKFCANSKIVQARIKKYYNRESQVIHPFIDINDFQVGKKSEEDYFLLVTRLAPWKRVDIAVSAFNKLGKKLKIIGDGPDRKRLESMAKNNITFLGKAYDDVKFKALTECIALIQTQFEDFGIVPLEAMASGKPVIAYGRGGVLETVVPHKTGEFFDIQKPEALIDVLNKFNVDNYSSQECRNRALEFDKPAFISRIKQFVSTAC